MNESAPTPRRRTRFTIVVPVYFNADNLPVTIPSLLGLEKEMPDVEMDLVFVDDGSCDDSLAVLRSYQEQWPSKISVIRLTRNFGSMNAILAGLHAAEGDCVGLISADLQDPPELFIEMLKRWHEGTKTVLAVREARDDSLGNRLFASCYYYLLRSLAIRNFPAGGFDFCLLDRQVVADIRQISEKNTSLPSLIVWLGYRPILIPYKRRKRQQGRSRWTTAKKIKLFIDGFVGFSYFPIRCVSVVGFLLAGVGFLYALFQVYARFVHGAPVQGFATIVILISITSGLQMIMLGTLGEYLWRALDETRKRPPYVIDDTFPRRK